MAVISSSIICSLRGLDLEINMQFWDYQSQPWAKPQNKPKFVLGKLNFILLPWLLNVLPSCSSYFSRVPAFFTLAFSKLALKKGFRPVHTKVLVTVETQNNLSRAICILTRDKLLAADFSASGNLLGKVNFPKSLPD